MANKYHPALRVLHWIMALLLIGQIFLGWYMEFPEDIAGMGKDTAIHQTMYNLHKFMGVLLGLVVLLITRIASFVPPLPETISLFTGTAAKISHYVLYSLMMAALLVGYTMSDSEGKGVKFFGLPLPKLLPDDKALGKTFGELHKIFGYTLLALIIVHIATAVRHRFFDKPENNVLPRII